MQTRSAMVGPSTASAYSSLNKTQSPDWDAENAILRNYLVNVAVFRCVQILAETLASLPFRAGNDPLKPQEFDTNAPLARLLGPPPGGPNPDMSPVALWTHSIAQYLVAGRFGWELEWSGTPGKSELIALWPLIAQHIHPMPAGPGEKAADGQPRYFKGFEYRADPAKRRDFSTSELYYDWHPAIYNLHQVQSPLQAARLDVSYAVKQDIYDNAFLDNDARPAGLLVTQAFENEDDYNAFESRLNDKYGGPTNAGKTLLVEQDTQDGNVTQSVNWISLGISQKDAQFFEQYQAKIRQICVAFGVPYSKLDASGRTFDNAGEEDETWEKNTIIPLANRLQQSINVRLAPLCGTETGWFDLSGLSTQKKRTNYIAVNPLDAFRDGVLSVNETREALGEEALKEAIADKVKALDPEPPPLALDPAADPKMLEEPKTKPEPEVDPKVTVKAGAKRATDLPEEGEPATRPDSHAPPLPVVERAAEDDAAQWRALDAQITAMEGMWQRSMVALFAEQQAAVRSRLEGKRGRQALTRAAEDEVPTDPEESPFIEALFTYEFWKKITEDRVNELAIMVSALALSRLLGKFSYNPGIDPNNPPESIRSVIRDRVVKVAKYITDTTRKDLARTLVDGVAVGESTEDLAARCDAVFKAAADVRAPLIAQMEAQTLFTATQAATVNEYPGDVIGRKKWIGEMDDRIRASHREVRGKIIDRNEKFIVGASLTPMDGPHDPTAPPNEVFGCRCLLDFLPPAEKRSADYRQVDEVIRELFALVAA